jgi:hypothetical protein
MMQLTFFKTLSIEIDYYRGIGPPTYNIDHTIKSILDTFNSYGNVKASKDPDRIRIIICNDKYLDHDLIIWSRPYVKGLSDALKVKMNLSLDV